MFLLKNKHNYRIVLATKDYCEEHFCDDVAEGESWMRVKARQLRRIPIKEGEVMAICMYDLNVTPSKLDLVMQYERTATRDKFISLRAETL